MGHTTSRLHFYVPDVNETGWGSDSPPGVSAGFDSADALAEVLADKDQANGYAGLDASGLLKKAEFPTLDKVEIGTTIGALEAKLTIVGDSTGALLLPVEIHTDFADGIDLYAHSDTQFRGGTFEFFRTRGTQAAPTEPQANDVVGQFTFGSGVSFVNAAFITAYATEAWGTNFGCELDFIFTPNGSSTPVNALKLDSTKKAATFGVPVIPAQYTVAALPVGLEGMTGYASNGRKLGEGAGSGTGVPVYFSSGSWRVYATDAPVAA